LPPSECAHSDAGGDLATEVRRRPFYSHPFHTAHTYSTATAVRFIAVIAMDRRMREGEARSSGGMFMRLPSLRGWRDLQCPVCPGSPQFRERKICAPEREPHHPFEKVRVWAHP